MGAARESPQISSWCSQCDVFHDKGPLSKQLGLGKHILRTFENACSELHGGEFSMSFMSNLFEFPGCLFQCWMC